MRCTRSFVLALVALGLPSVALARPGYLAELEAQSGQTGLTCATCHLTDGGGSDCGSPPCLRAFGQQVRSFRIPANASTWWSTLASRDADGDGYSNGLELGDIDGDGTVDGVVLSDINRSEGDLNECTNGMAICPAGQFCSDRIACTSTGRPSYECSPTPTDPPPPPAWLDEPWTRPIDVTVGEWVDIDTVHAINPAVPTACGVSGASAWLNVRPAQSCAGRLVVERRWADGTDPGPTRVAWMDAPDCRGVPREVGCSNASGVTLPTNPTLVRVFGRFLGQLRVACVPRGRCTVAPDDVYWNEYGGGAHGLEPPGDAAACGPVNPTCEHAQPVAEGTHRIDAAGLGCSGSGSPWLEHEATCTGTLRVESRMAWNEDMEGEPGITLGLHAGACPGGDTLACGSASSVGPWDYGESRAVAVATTEVVLGERVFITVAGSRHQENVSISCIPDADEVHCGHCAPRAECHYDAPDDAPFCVCEDRTTGDGIAVERGGTGCRSVGLDPYCADAGLECHENASCGLNSSGGAFCMCNEGYRGSGFECVDDDQCGRGTAGCGVNTRCYELEGVPAVCFCAPGYSRVDRGRDRVDCLVICGDGEMGPGEECDDGNTTSGDGCSDWCDEELNFRCEEIQSRFSVCESTCGDGVVDENEEFICDGTIDLDECGCRTPGADPRGPGLWLLVVGFWLVRRRRRA